jgi:threonine/homoserine/homoserine lactone efflux protein
MPIGPIGALCIRRSLAFGRTQGVVTETAGATADVVYMTVALFGIRFIADFIALGQHSIRLCGGIAVIANGIVAVLSRPGSGPRTKAKYLLTRLYAPTFLLALSNPVPLLGFAALLPAMGLQDIQREAGSSALFISGVFVGSILWFSLLVNTGHFLRITLTDKKLVLIDKVAGLTLLLFGIVAAASSISALSSH